MISASLNVRALTGGYEGWAESGRPVVKPAPAPAIAPAPTAAVAVNPTPQTASAPAEDGGRDAWQRVPDIITALGIATGSRVADVGAGDGFFTTRLAAAVGTEGRVYAVDVSKNALDRLSKRVTAAGLGNVEPSSGRRPIRQLPAGTLDAALIVNAYHEMREHQSMLAGIKRALKPGGRLVILESVAVAQRNIPRDAQESRHQLAAHYLQQDALQPGFQVARFEDPFTRPNTRSPEYLLVLTPIAATVEAPPEPAHDHAADDTWRKPDEVVAALAASRRHDGRRSGRGLRCVHAPVRARDWSHRPRHRPRRQIRMRSRDDEGRGVRRSQANYEARLVKAEDPAIPAASADVVFVSNAYHHIDDRVAYFTRLRPSLKAGWPSRDRRLRAGTNGRHGAPGSSAGRARARRRRLPARACA